jgi:cell division protease FtsH
MRDSVLGVAAGIALFLAWQGYNVLPVLFLVGLAFILTQQTGLRGLSRRHVTVGAPANSLAVTFQDIGGQPTAKKELVEALDFVTRQDKIRRLGIRPLKGILLTGPPGTGKTLLAKAAASYTDSVFLATSGSEFVEIYAGVGAQRVRQLFEQAREQARKERKNSAIIFIDEIEVLGGKRGQHSGHLEYDQTLNQLLVAMDGLAYDDAAQLVVVAATNRLDLIDTALLRPGRFDRIVNVDLPDREGRRQILELHTRNKPLAADVDLGRLARETFGFSGAHLESMANEAAILALREDAGEVCHRHLEEAVNKVIMGEKLDRRPSDEERWRIALHEAGHALLAELGREGAVSSISITSRGASLGHVRHAPEDDYYLSTRSYLEGQIRTAIAGAVAEEIVLGQKSTGAMNDFEAAIGLAKRIVQAGLSHLGIVGEDITPGRSYQQAVNDILREQEAAARQSLADRAEILKRVASDLIERESLGGDEFRRVAGLPLPGSREPALTAASPA